MLLDPYNRTTIIVTLVVGALLVESFYLLITRYDHMMRLLHVGLTCDAPSNKKAAGIVVTGLVFGLSLPMTLGLAVQRAEARRRRLPFNTVELAFGIILTVGSGTLLLSLATC